ncbi:MAG: hypothetical protein WCT50_02180 [Patescibacteria group bacterium]|jgi:hypothetical protein
MLKKLFLATILSGIFIINLAAVQATTSPTGLVPKATGEASVGCNAPAGSGLDDKTYCGDYRLEDFISIAIIASKWILGIVGSLSLVMFIYGGIMFLISAGSSDKIGQARKIIIAAIVGLVIVFSSYLIIQFVVSGIGTVDKYKFDGKIDVTTP